MRPGPPGIPEQEFPRIHGNAVFFQNTAGIPANLRLQLFLNCVICGRLSWPALWSTFGRTVFDLIYFSEGMISQFNQIKSFIFRQHGPLKDKTQKHTHKHKQTEGQTEKSKLHLQTTG